MVRPFPRYWSLLHKRGQKFEAQQGARIVGDFSTQDYRDLQVWFNLAWFGYAAAHEYPELGELKRKGRDFTEDDKQTVFARQQDILQTIIARYKAAQDRGQIEISTTPFYHPILPLVYDTEFGRRCLPSFVAPRRFAHPEDVRAQLDSARQQYQRLFGRDPVGLWPSEGSVCPELIPILAEQGWQWLATDEEILWRSLPAGKDIGRANLWQAYRAEFAGRHVAAVFRDRSISDFIGFSAARNTPQRAAEHVLGQIEAVAQASAPDALCAVVLDGENAWEHFSDGGEGFLKGLYDGSLRATHIRPTTMAQHVDSFPPQSTIGALHTGSWINANFHIWIGHAEDRQAWDILGRTRDLVEGRFRRGEIPAAQYQQAMEEIYAAEGSDWFWWYGDDFITDDDVVFDELFRTHLENACRLAGVAVPHILQVPICRSETARVFHSPTSLIKPAIDGRVTSYYEWMGAGKYEAERTASTMYRTERVVQAIWYGFDARHLYIRLDYCDQNTWPEGVALQFHLQAAKKLLVAVQRDSSGRVTADLQTPGGNLPCEVAYNEVLEFAVALDDAGCQAGQAIGLAVKVIRAGIELERHPTMGEIGLTVPDPEAEIGNWSA
jgi:alpha-amylase/alpha-mannosidase (GH57 family)